MSIDLSHVTGISDSRGVITEIKDSLGRVIWAAVTGKPAILQVAKQTLTTYAGETEYADESFVAIDVYPRKNGTVKVTYGGLTKTVKDTSGAEKPNAQTVYFGTMYGVTDSVTTPDSGELTIEGGYNNFAAGAYKEKGKYGGEISAYCSCITGVTDWGNVETEIASNAFRGCASLTLTSLPSGVTHIGSYSFYQCSNLALTSLPSGVTNIGNSAFVDCYNVKIDEFPNGLTYIGERAFFMTTYNKTLMYGGTITLPSALQSIGSDAFRTNKTSGESFLTYVAKAIIHATTPPTAGTKIFGIGSYKTSSGSISIVVPNGCSEAYKNADGWSYYSSRITEAS